MTTCEDLTAPVAAVFTEAMTRLVAGVAVITARRADGEPCGLLVSSICSYSIQPPSVLVAIDQASRSYATLVECAEFGAHLLGSGQADLAHVFAGKGEDKFAGLPWAWDGAVPRLRGVPVYLSCARRSLFHHGDHAIVVGEVMGGDLRPGDPLVYFRRGFNWRLRACP